MTSPCGEMNDAEQPPAIRNEARRTCSSHACEGVKPYFAATVFDGKLSNVHMPSSACIACVRTRHDASNPATKIDRFFAFTLNPSPATSRWPPQRHHYLAQNSRQGKHRCAWAPGLALFET